MRIQGFGGKDRRKMATCKSRFRGEINSKIGLREIGRR
jgi:hypothetical protein